MVNINFEMGKPSNDNPFSPSKQEKKVNKYARPSSGMPSTPQTKDKPRVYSAQEKKRDVKSGRDSKVSKESDEQVKQAFHMMNMFDKKLDIADKLNELEPKLKDYKMNNFFKNNVEVKPKIINGSKARNEVRANGEFFKVFADNKKQESKEEKMMVQEAKQIDKVKKEVKTIISHLSSVDSNYEDLLKQMKETAVWDQDVFSKDEKELLFKKSGNIDDFIKNLHSTKAFKAVEKDLSPHERNIVEMKNVCNEISGIIQEIKEIAEKPKEFKTKNLLDLKEITSKKIKIIDTEFQVQSTFVRADDEGNYDSCEEIEENDFKKTFYNNLCSTKVNVLKPVKQIKIDKNEEFADLHEEMLKDKQEKLNECEKLIGEEGMKELEAFLDEKMSV